MDENELFDIAGKILHKLCVDIPSRRVGSEGNIEATNYFEELTSANGFKTESLEFDCIDWEGGEVHLEAEGESFEAFASPYSLGCDLRGELVAASSQQELDTHDLSGKILLMHGDIVKGQLMPKDYPFYYPEEHKRIYDALERKKPAAIITATGRDPGMAGAMYPFSLFEDGNFDIPSVYMKDVEGERLLDQLPKTIQLRSDATRIPSYGRNPIARRGVDDTQKIVLTAHIDAKMGTPGAIDNAGGVVVLGLLSRLLAKYDGETVIELIAFNGEDNYSAPGQLTYINTYGGTFPAIRLAINLDGLGYHEGKTAFSLYECPKELEKIVKDTLAEHDEFVQGDQWYQSDHSIFIQSGVPAMAITTDQFAEAWSRIAHTELDTPEIVDIAKLVRAALGLADLVEKLTLA